MSIYQRILQLGSPYIPKNTLFKWGFNLFPMYRRSSGKVLEISADFLYIRIKLPISYKNRNYVGSIFGGSMFAAVDPMPMIQLMQALGDEFVVWDKSAEIHFRIPAREDLYANFDFTTEEVERLKKQVIAEGEYEMVKTTQLTDVSGDRVYCEVHKRLYIAGKDFFREKRAKRKRG